MITKAIVKSVNGSRNRCIVRMPLFETADSSAPVEAEALVNIPPGIFNNLFEGDVVFVGFEENALEKPIILGKLFRGTSFEDKTNGGVGILDTLMVRKRSSSPGPETHFRYENDQQATYKYLDNAKEIADYILWLENLTKTLIKQLDEHFRCFKNWTQWQLKPENVEIDDGNIDSAKEITPKLYQDENKSCHCCCDDKCVCDTEDSKDPTKACVKCTKNNVRTYSKLKTDAKFSDSLSKK